MTKNEAREAARVRAAAEREALARRTRRRRTLGIGAAVVAVLAVGGLVVGLVLASTGTAASAGAAAGRTSAPPWAAPADVQARVKAAGLRMLTSEGEALHIHEHLSITVDGRAVQVPADIGIDEAAQQLSAIHTHDTTGIIHVESPVVQDFTLGQVFDEWDVHLAKGQVGGYRDGDGRTKVVLYVDRKPYSGDPAALVLGAKQDIDFVVTTDGSAAAAPAKAYVFPAGY